MSVEQKRTKHFFRAWAKWQEPGEEDKKSLKSMAEDFVRDLVAFFPNPDFYHS